MTVMEKWLEDIRKSQEDFTVSEPEGLWEGIEVELDGQDSRRRGLLLWLSAATAAVAAIAALVLFLAGPWRKDVQEIQREDAAVAVIADNMAGNTVETAAGSAPMSGRPPLLSDLTESAAGTAGRSRTDANADTDAAADSGPESGQNLENGNTAAAEPPTAEIQDEIPLNQEKPRETAGQETSVRPEEPDEQETSVKPEKPAGQETSVRPEESAGGRGAAQDYDFDNRSDKRKRRESEARSGGFRVGVSASNIAGSRSTSPEYAALYGSTVTAQLHSFSESVADFPDSQGYAGVLQSNSDKDITSKVRNRQPVQVGLSVAYAFTDRLSLESGLTYSCLISDLSSGTESSGYDIRQTLHYLGVPLSLRYDFLRFRRFSLYASAGGQMQKCVAGKTVTDYRVDGRKTASENGSIRVNPLQWSVNAYAGAQYDFSRIAGIYVEPGAAYYFRNGSPVNCIYSERPFNFSIRLGLRFTLH